MHRWSRAFCERASTGPSPTKVTYTLSESIEQLSKPSTTVPLADRPDWHATQLGVVLLFTLAYAGFWASDHVELLVRHHRLETYDKRRILMLFQDERIRMMARHVAERSGNDEGRILQLQRQTEALHSEVQHLRSKLDSLAHPGEKHERVPRESWTRYLRLWVPRIKFNDRSKPAQDSDENR